MITATAANGTPPSSIRVQPVCRSRHNRHTFATNYLRQGGDIARLSMVLGHTQITTTRRYLHPLTQELSASHMISASFVFEESLLP